METEQHKDELKSELKKIIRQHKAFQNERLFLFGFSYIMQAVVYTTLQKENVHVEAFLDNSPDKIGTCFGEITVIAPEELPVDGDVYVLIHSSHAKEMITQLERIDATIRNRIIHLEYPKKDSDGFWKEEQYQKSFRMLMEGRKLYEEIAEDGVFLVVGPEFSLGDYSLLEMTLPQFLAREGIRRHKTVVCGNGAARVVELFGEENIVPLNLEQMSCFLKYVMFMGEEVTNALVVCPQFYASRRLHHLYNADHFTASEMYPKLVYQISEPYEPRYPDIFQPLSDELQKELQLIKGRGLVLAPYANTVGALPDAFWSGIITFAKERGYTVYTNVTPSQTELEGTRRLDVPFSQMGTALELVGSFISIRSGLNDIVGRASCKQIVIYNKVYKTFGNEIHGYEHADLGPVGVAPGVIQIILEKKDMDDSFQLVKQELLK